MDKSEIGYVVAKYAWAIGAVLLALILLRSPYGMILWFAYVYAGCVAFQR